MKNFNLLLNNSSLLTKEWDTPGFKILNVVLITPTIEVNKKELDYLSEPQTTTRIKCPMLVEFTRADYFWTFSLSFIVGFRISYQWGY